MNPLNRQRLLGLIAAVAVALLLGDRLVLTPLSKSWNARSARIADLRKKVTQGTLLLDRADSIRDRWADMRANALTNETSAAENQLLKAFEQWSKDSGVGVSSIRPQWKRDDDDTFTLECRADAFGSVANLTRFLYLVETDPLAIRIDSVELSRRDPKGQELTLVLQINGLLLQPPRS